MRAMGCGALGYGRARMVGGREGRDGWWAERREEGGGRKGRGEWREDDG